MLQQPQKDFVLNKILKEAPLPFLFRGRLGKALLPVLINDVDNMLSGSLPLEIQELVNSAADGLTPEETQYLKKSYTDHAISSIKNPATAAISSIVIPMIVETIVESLASGQKL